MCSQAIAHRDYQTNISFNNVINYWWYCTWVVYFKFISNLNVFIITIQRKKSSKWSKRASNDRFSDKARIYQSLQCFNLPALIKKKSLHIRFNKPSLSLANNLWTVALWPFLVSLYGTIFFAMVRSRTMSYNFFCLSFSYLVLLYLYLFTRTQIFFVNIIALHGVTRYMEVFILFKNELKWWLGDNVMLKERKLITKASK